MSIFEFLVHSVIRYLILPLVYGQPAMVKGPDSCFGKVCKVGHPELLRDGVCAKAHLHYYQVLGCVAFLD